MKKLLIVIDYQNDFVNGSLGSTFAQNIEDNIYNKVKNYLDQGIRVVFTKDTHYDEHYMETREGKYLPVMHCIKGTEGHKLYGKLVEFENNDDVEIYDKESFGAKNLSSIIDGEYDEIEFCGVATNICVISNAIIAQTVKPNAEIIIDASCCASFDPKLHNYALDVMEGLQMQIINKDEN